MLDVRLRAVYDAASTLFIRRGYANTQVSQIAAEAKIATGSIYALFTGKRAILHFVLLSSLHEDYLERDITLPFDEVDTELIRARLTQVAEELLEAIGQTPAGEPRNSFTEMISTMFDYASSYRVAFNIINDNPEAVGDVAEVYREYVDYKLSELVEANLLRYIARGEVRKVEHPFLHLRNLFEGITWWGMLLPYKTYLPYKKEGISTAEAKEIAIDILRHAYLTNP